MNSGLTHRETMRTRYGRDPFWLSARFNSKCACGAEVKRGERGFYYPNDRRMLCSKCGEGAAREFASAAQDEAFMTGGSK